MLEGHCFCGFVRYTLTGAPYHQAICHCTICRRTSGAPFVAWFTVPRATFSFVAGAPAKIRSSDHGTRSFCPRCGTPLAFTSDRSPDEIDVTTCSLADPSLVPPKDHTHVRSRVGWVRLCDGLPEFLDHRLP